MGEKTKIEWCDDAIDAATRIVCLGLPLEGDPGIAPEKSMLADLARGHCFGPDCLCWEKGRAIVRSGLNAAKTIQDGQCSVMPGQPEKDRAG